MADLREAIKQITGKEPSPEQINRIQAIAHALDIPQGDAMFPILATLDIYYGTFTELPASMEASANKIAEKAERDTQGRIAAASAELVSKAGKQLVDAFRADLGKTLWSRSIWAGLVLVVVGIGSYAAGEVDIWWHSRQLHQIEAKKQKVLEEISALKTNPDYYPVYNCGGRPCVPVLRSDQVGGPWSLTSGKYKGTPLGVLDMQKIQQMEHPSQ